MSKYIIKNCPAYHYDEQSNYHICKQPLVPYECSVDDCQDCTDCVMKQIVERCLNGIDFTIFKAVDGCYSERGILAKEILDLLDIKEVE